MRGISYTITKGATIRTGDYLTVDSEGYIRPRESGEVWYATAGEDITGSEMVWGVGGGASGLLYNKK